MKISNSKVWIIVLTAILIAVISGGMYYSKIRKTNNEVTSNKAAKSVDVKANDKTKDDKTKDDKQSATKQPEDKQPEDKQPVKDNFEGKKLKNNDKGIPVLMYHCINDKAADITVSPAALRQQLQYLKDNDYTVLTMDEAYDFLQNNKPVPEKSVVLTFDDGYEDNYQNAFPILKEFGVKATFYIITDVVDTNALYMTSNEIKEMNAAGMDMESHTVKHEDLKTLTYDKQLETLKNSKTYLEKLLDKKINYIAYPYGHYNNDTARATKDAGYLMAFTTDGRWSNKDNGIYKLDRVFISGLFPLATFKERITNPQYKVN